MSEEKCSHKHRGSTWICDHDYEGCPNCQIDLEEEIIKLNREAKIDTV